MDYFINYRLKELKGYPRILLSDLDFPIFPEGKLFLKSLGFEDDEFVFGEDFQKKISKKLKYFKKFLIELNVGDCTDQEYLRKKEREWSELVGGGEFSLVGETSLSYCYTNRFPINQQQLSLDFLYQSILLGNELMFKPVKFHLADDFSTLFSEYFLAYKDVDNRNEIGHYNESTCSSECHGEHPCFKKSDVILLTGAGVL